MAKRTWFERFQRWLFPAYALRFAVAAIAVSSCSDHPLDDLTFDFRVTGRVTELQTGAPVAGLVVSIRENGGSDDRYHLSEKTDADGQFAFRFRVKECLELYVVSARTDPVLISCTQAWLWGDYIALVVMPGR